MENPILNKKLIEKVSSDINANFYLINKDSSAPSFSIIYKIRKITGLKKVGFSGTLDPLASGLMIIATSSATKLLDAFHFLNKTYFANIELGKISSTYDREGSVTTKKVIKKPTKNIVDKIIKENFTGAILQTPPIFSAKKINGERLYKLARKDISIEITPAKINIEKIKILKYKYPNLALEITCSKGTYIRSIANDLGEKLDTGAMLTKLQRTKIGNFNIKNAIKQSKISKNILDKKKIKIPEILKTLQK
jgi:tRNA pseudouridine55 synthase